MRLRGYYFITDSRLSNLPPWKQVEKAIIGGAEIIQYREKDLDKDKKLVEARRVGEACKDKALLIINDDVDIAKAVDADGVHIGQDDGSLKQARQILGRGKIIGVTVHDLEEALAAWHGGADYVACSPIYETDTKSDAGRPKGIKLISDVKGSVDVPVAAIGGINLDNLKEVIDAGADMVCAISAALEDDDIVENVKKLQKVFK
jgi:thiamine-phosphate diphosphorylase